MWNAIRHHVVDGIEAAFETRLSQVQVAAERAQHQYTEEMHGPRVLEVLAGPFRSNLPVLITESDGTTVRYANSAFEKLTGYTHEEVEGVPIKQLLHGPDTSTAVTEALAAAVRRSLAASARLVNYQKGGSPFLNLIRFEPVYDDDRGTGMVFWVVLQDVGHNSLEVVQGPQGQRLLPSTPQHGLDDAWGT